MSLDNANEVVTYYDALVGNSDGLLSALELTKVLVDLDIAGNNNGVLNYEELMQFMNAGLADVDFGTITQEKYNLYETAKSYVNNYAGNDKEFSAVEFSNLFFANWGLSPENAAEIISYYDKNHGNENGTLDVNELAEMLIQLDVNNNGKWDKAEVMISHNALTTIDFGGVDDSNTAQKFGIFNTIVGYANGSAGSDKEFSVTEIYNWLTNNWGITLDMAADIVAHYDTNNNGTLDTLELAQAVINLDNAGNSNGIWDKAEVMNFLDNALTTIDFGGVDDSNYVEKHNLYKAAVSYINNNAGGDKEFSADELSKWLSANWALTPDRAAEIINYYDNNIGNGNGKLDVMELAQVLMSLDVNNNGIWDKAEVMNFIDEALTDIDFGGVNDANVAQKHGLFTNALNYIHVNAGSDKEFSAIEFKNWLKASWGITDSMAEEIIQHYNTNGSVDADGNQTMDVYEFAQALVNLDQISNNGNNNGLWDKAEVMNFLNDGLTTTNIGVISTEDNETQAKQLYNTALNLINSVDKTNDRKISADEYYTYYLLKLGLPRYIADGFIEAYDKDNDNLVDVMELVDQYMGLDANTTGALEFHETMFNFQTMANAGLGVETFNFNPSINNSQQLNNAFNVWTSFVMARDTNSDRLIQTNELQQFLMTKDFVASAVTSNVAAYDTNSDGKLDAVEKSNAMSSVANTLAANAMSIYDMNGDGTVDAFEWMDALLKIDTNGNGLMDAAEQVEFYRNIGANI